MMSESLKKKVFAPLGSLLIFYLLTPASSFGANLDDAAWLIKDEVSEDLFVLRVEMKTSKVGSATIAGGNRFAGSRDTGQGSKFGVNLLGGGFTVTKDGAVPFMMAGFNRARDEIFGEFVDSQGNGIGEFTGTLLGHTDFQSDLFQVCKTNSDDDFRCVNRGRDERCEVASRGKQTTFLDASDCRDSLVKKTAPPAIAAGPSSGVQNSDKAQPSGSDTVRFKKSDYMELFGISLMQEVEDIEGWDCRLTGRAWTVKTYQCTEQKDAEKSFAGFAPFAVSLWANTYGVCVISGIRYQHEAASGIYDYQARIAAPLLFDLGVPALPAFRALNPKNSDYPVFGGVPLDKIGMERGGKILRWENLGRQENILQLEAYEVDPENRIYSEGEALNSLFTASGVPADSKVNVAMLTLFGGWWEHCGIQ